MDLVATGLTLAAVIVTVVAIALPLIRTRSEGEFGELSNDDQLSDLGRMREARNTALTAIMDLDDELERGNITPVEHRASRIPLVRRAAALIREIEGREQILDEEIERALQLRRERIAEAGHPAPPDDSTDSGA